VVGSNQTITALQNSGFTVGVASAHDAGINFSAPRTGVLKITAMGSIGANPTTASAWGVQLYESTGSTVIATMGGDSFGTGTTYLGFIQSLTGYLSVTSGTTYNVIMRGITGSGTLFIGSTGTSGSTGGQLGFTMEYIS
jgi:hypothetical protein